MRSTSKRFFSRLDQFVHIYLQFQMILDEIGITTQDAIMYLKNLESEMDTLTPYTERKTLKSLLA